MIYGKQLLKFFCICLLIKKLINKKYFPINEKHFSIKKKFGLVSRKIISFYFERKTLFENYEKFKNVIIFTDYIKFDHQTFDCYIYILF